MGSPLEARLYEILTLDNLIWLIAFIGGCITIYWRLRNYLSNKTKEHMSEIAADTARTIIDQVTKDNIVTELNMREVIDQKIADVHKCTERIEAAVDENAKNIAAMKEDYNIHKAISHEKDKSLERVTKIVDSAMTLVNKVAPIVRPSVENIDSEKTESE